MPPKKKKAKVSKEEEATTANTSKEAMKGEGDDIDENRDDDSVNNPGQVSIVASLSLEQIRLANMKRNSEFLADLGLDQDKTSWRILDNNGGDKTAPTRRGQGPKKTIVFNPTITRRSGRITSERLKSEIQSLKSSDKVMAVDPSVLVAKELELEAMMAKKYEISYQATIDAENESDYSRLSPDPISLLYPSNFGVAESVNAGQPLIDLLRQLEIRPTTATTKKERGTKSPSSPPSSSSLGGGGAGSKSRSDSAYQTMLKKWTVSQDDVAKLTESRITSVAFHPSSTKLIAMAGDKLGHIGIWDVNSSANEVTGGVYRYRPHVRNVAGIHSWKSDPSKIYTTSYDGTVRYIDLEKESFCQCFEAPESFGVIIYSDAAFSPYDSYSMLVGRSDGFLSHIDLREAHSHRGKNSYCYSWNKSAQEGSKLNSVQYHPIHEHQVICGGSGKFGHITVHDMRKVGATFRPLYQHDLHSKSINAAYVSPDGEFVVSVSLDNTVRATSNFLSSSPTSVVMRHDNHTGRWLSTFKPSFDPKRANTFALGSMDKPRKVGFYHITSGKGGHSISPLYPVQTELLASVCSRNCFHPSLDVIAAANSSGRVHIVR